MRPVIFVSGPYTSQMRATREENVERAAAVSGRLHLMGAVTLCPHTMWHHLYYLGEYDRILSDCLDLIRFHSDAIFLIPGWEKSAGCTAEHEAALGASVEVLRSFDDAQAFINSYLSEVNEWQSQEQPPSPIKL